MKYYRSVKAAKSSNCAGLKAYKKSPGPKTTQCVLET